MNNRDMLLLASGTPPAVSRMFDKVVMTLPPGEYEVHLYRVGDKKPLPGDVGMAEMPTKMTMQGNNLGVPVLDLEGMVS